MEAADEPIFNDAIGTSSPALIQNLAALKERPDLAGRQFAVGVEYGRLSRFDAARHHLRQAVHLDPKHPQAHSALAEILLLGGQTEQAVHHARAALQLAPKDQGLAIALASALAADRQTQAAWDIVDELLGAGCQTTPLALLYASLTIGRGHESQAIELISRLLNASPPRPPRERASLHFAAGRLLDHLGIYDAAFEEASRGNALRGVSYDAALVERLTAHFMQFFTRSTMRRLARSSLGSQTPVFIVGMPRSGTSLVEQVLASHPSVVAAGERDWVFRLWESAVQRYDDPAAPLFHSIERLTVADVDAMASQYLGYLRWLGPEAARVTDKTPNNLMHLGLIALLFPAAKVIHCRRDPMDTCLSCFMTDFAFGNQFSFSQESLGHYYRHAERMASHWQAELDLAILDVNYEEMVNDLEGQARRMLEFVGLPWDDRCLRFHELARFVPTASALQVQQPIHQRSVRRWRNYRQHLGSLRAALGLEPE